MDTELLSDVLEFIGITFVQFDYCQITGKDSGEIIIRPTFVTFDSRSMADPHILSKKIHFRINGQEFVFFRVS